MGVLARDLRINRPGAVGGDWRLTPFTGASIGAYVGLVPTEYSSGASRRHLSSVV